VESLFDFFLISLVVECEEPLEDFTTRGFGDREANALFGFVEVGEPTSHGKTIAAEQDIRPPIPGTVVTPDLRNEDVCVPRPRLARHCT
jgi:hypothetical protein